MKSLMKGGLTGSAVVAATVVAILGAEAAQARLGAERIIATLSVLAYLGWILVETATVTRREEGRPSSSRDAGTLELYTIARAATVLAALVFDDVPMGPWAGTGTGTGTGTGIEVGVGAGAGCLVLVAGITLRAWAIRVLAECYSHRVRVDEGHRLITHGPYRFVRHPAYCGMILAHVGWCLVFASVPGALALGCLLVPAVVMRLLVEERALGELEGYHDYARGTARLIPGVL